jgi:hypothetical protein
MRAISKGMVFVSMLLSLACDGTSVDAAAVPAGESSQEQSIESSAASGYCTLDCSRCSSTRECLSRGAGSCTSIPAC